VQLLKPLRVAALVALVDPSALPAQNPAPIAVRLPVGTYVVAIQPTDSLPAEISGDWRIVFETSGTYRVVRNGNVVVLGEYRTAADTLLLVDRSGEMACMGAAGPATYTWGVRPDGSLMLVAVQDQCTGRMRLTTLRALPKAKAE
jgi:hypothetical protein